VALGSAPRATRQQAAGKQRARLVELIREGRSGNDPAPLDEQPGMALSRATVRAISAATRSESALMNA